MSMAQAPVETPAPKSDGNLVDQKTPTLNARGGDAKIEQHFHSSDPKEVARAASELNVDVVRQRDRLRQHVENLTQELKSMTDEVERLKKRNDELEERVQVVDELQRQVDNFDKSRRKGNLQDEKIKRKGRELMAELEKRSKQKIQVADKMGDAQKNLATNFKLQVQELKREGEKDKAEIKSLKTQVDNLTWKLEQSPNTSYQDDLASELAIEQQEPPLSEEEKIKISQLEKEKEDCDKKLKENYNEDKIEKLRRRLSGKKKAFEALESDDEDYQKEKDEVDTAERAVPEAIQTKKDLEKKIEECKEQIENIREESRKRIIPRLVLPSDSGFGSGASTVSRPRSVSVGGRNFKPEGPYCSTCGQRRDSTG